MVTQLELNNSTEEILLSMFGGERYDVELENFLFF